ncbi:MAG: alpha/beta hydrolase [Methanobacteriaceae archaeon]|nr:alpha/beta hydrolase [Methanobacteriaceae archaeon]MDP2836541.1 alpha/beta hydrolase [Methanobacteriaceae archaeon]MDP3485294.1 alpha/beta hydrolase [Methanobacteriaceae archaeon]
MKYFNSKKKFILIFFLALILIAVAGFTYYVSDYYPADNTALSALQSTAAYSVENTADFITFTPTGNKSATGIIFYPGGKVQAESYATLASKLAENNYTTIIVKMPFNLAFFGANQADSVISDHPEIKKWIMGGHSLGGVFASDYAVNNQDKISGVIYLAAYPSANASNATFKALSIRGSLDNLTQESDISDNKNKFPTNTTFITIEGGNHFNFGDYGVQAGDNNSTITREQQQNQTVNYIIEFINGL